MPIGFTSKTGRFDKKFTPETEEEKKEYAKKKQDALKKEKDKKASE